MGRNGTVHDITYIFKHGKVVIHGWYNICTCVVYGRDKRLLLSIRLTLAGRGHLSDVCYIVKVKAADALLQITLGGFPVDTARR
jgi:hypothetical protein